MRAFVFCQNAGKIHLVAQLRQNLRTVASVAAKIQLAVFGAQLFIFRRVVIE